MARCCQCSRDAMNSATLTQSDFFCPGGGGRGGGGGRRGLREKISNMVISVL